MHLEGGNVPGNQISAGTKGHDLRQPPRIDALHFEVYRSKREKVLRHIFLRMFQCNFQNALIKNPAFTFTPSRPATLPLP